MSIYVFLSQKTQPSITLALDANIYFAHPYHSWERGLNENTNGLIRQYFTKGKDFAELNNTTQLF